MLLKTKRYQLDVDVTATRNYYRTAPMVSCGCEDNSYLFHMTLAPSETQQFFQALGVDPLKPEEHYVVCEGENEITYYGLCYLAGRLLSHDKTKKVWDPFWKKRISSLPTESMAGMSVSFEESGIPGLGIRMNFFLTFQT